MPTHGTLPVRLTSCVTMCLQQLQPANPNLRVAFRKSPLRCPGEFNHGQTRNDRCQCGGEIGTATSTSSWPTVVSPISRIALFKFSTAPALQISGPTQRANVVILSVESLIIVIFLFMGVSLVIRLFSQIDDGRTPLPQDRRSTSSKAGKTCSWMCSDEGRGRKPVLIHPLSST